MRQKITVSGRIIALIISGSNQLPSLIARVESKALADVSEIDLVFQGRREIPGIMAGKIIAASGACDQSTNPPRILNPEYELIG